MYTIIRFNIREDKREIIYKWKRRRKQDKLLLIKKTNICSKYPLEILVVVHSTFVVLKMEYFVLNDIISFMFE